MIICPKTGLFACGYGCCSKVNKNIPYSPNIGIACGNKPCNAQKMPYGNWGQSIQTYQTYNPVTTLDNENIVATGNIFDLPTAYGKFMPYTPQQWGTGKKQKLESLNWRMVRARELGPGSLV